MSWTGLSEEPSQSLLPLTSSTYITVGSLASLMYCSNEYITLSPAVKLITSLPSLVAVYVTVPTLFSNVTSPGVNVFSSSEVKPKVALGKYTSPSNSAKFSPSVVDMNLTVKVGVWPAEIEVTSNEGIAAIQLVILDESLTTNVGFSLDPQKLPLMSPTVPPIKVYVPLLLVTSTNTEFKMSILPDL